MKTGFLSSTAPRALLSVPPLARFSREERGSVTFFVLVLSVGLMAMMGLVMDTGRTFSAHSQVQAYVDNVALAMARELDGQPMARDRARAIMQASGSLVSTLTGPAIEKSSTMTGDALGDGGKDFTIFEPIFLTGQPMTMGSKIELSDYQHLIATNDEDVTHVLVIGETQEVPWTLLNMTSLVTGGGSARTSADGTGKAFGVQTWATAELVRDQLRTNERLMVCGCEVLGADNLDAGQLLQLGKSRNGDWSCGNYGVIATLQDDAMGTCAGAGYAEGSAESFACKLGLDNPSSYYHDQTVDAFSDVTQGDGSDQFSVHAGLNTRFGIYDDVLSALQNSTGVSPDRNTITGDLYSCSGEQFDTVSDSAALPTDTCFNEGTCTVASETVDPKLLTEYCERTHGGACPTNQDGTPVTSRYELYMAEIAAGMLDPVGAEGVNTCNTAATAQADRRVVEVAIADCSGISGQTSPTDIPVMAYAEVFLSTPANNTEFYNATFDAFRTPSGDLIQMREGDVVSGDAEYNGQGYNQFDPYADVGLTISGISGRDDGQGEEAGDALRAPMLFDTNYYSGADDDLATTGRGNVLILSENGDAQTFEERTADWAELGLASPYDHPDAHRKGPDDDGQGGSIVFRFSEPTYVHSLVVFDTDGGGAIRAFDTVLSDDELAALDLDDGSHRDIAPDVVLTGDGENTQEQTDQLAGAFWAKGAPELGDNKHVRVEIGQEAVRTLVYTLENDSGAIDELVFFNSLTQFQLRDQLTVEFIEYIDESDGRMNTYAHISN
ncbi:MAG: Tad domain-containing protein [Pseudomonadota bacterium]